VIVVAWAWGLGHLGDHLVQAAALRGLAEVGLGDGLKTHLVKWYMGMGIWVWVWVKYK
jgi:hypothetical protein